MSFLETQAGVFQRMSEVVGRLSQLGTQMRDPAKTVNDVSNDFAEVSKLQDELSSYRMAQFNGRNLMNYLDPDANNQISGTTAETLSVGLSQEGNKNLNITQSDVANQGPLHDLLGPITAGTSPGRDAVSGVNSAADFLDEVYQWGQKGSSRLMEDLAQRMAVNQAEQSQLRLNLDRIRERMLGTDAATSRVADVDVAKELSVLTRTDMQLRSAVATKTQSNVLADSALKILSNQDFSSPLIQEARLATASTRSLVG
jgi:flagellin-like hook-associated protein FlgL